MNRFVLVDPSRCIGCRTCEISCILSHLEGHIGSINPADFHPRLSIVKDDETSAALTCRHCEDAPCARACPYGAIIQKGDSIQVIQEKCVGCKNCVTACPSGAMSVYMQPVPLKIAGNVVGYVKKAHATKCDLCVDSSKGSACVAACPTGALKLVSSDEVSQNLTSCSALSQQ